MKQQVSRVLKNAQLHTASAVCESSRIAQAYFSCHSNTKW